MSLLQNISFIYCEKLFLKLFNGTLSNARPDIGQNRIGTHARHGTCDRTLLLLAVCIFYHFAFWLPNCLQLLLAFVVLIRIIVECTPIPKDNDSAWKRGGGLRTELPSISEDFVVAVIRPELIFGAGGSSKDALPYLKKCSHSRIILLQFA